MTHTYSVEAQSNLESTVEVAIPLIDRAQVWWNHNYVYRRLLSLIIPRTGLPEGHVLSVYLPKSIFTQGKVRSDFEDIEVLYMNSAIPEDWTVLGRSVTAEAGFYRVDTELGFDLSPESVNYGRLFVYYGNPNLLDQPVRPSYTYDQWPLTANPDSEYIAYTRPGIDWVDGVSSTKDAKATFSFWGPQARLYLVKGPNKGFVEVQLDEGDWLSYDTFNHTSTSSLVYEVSGLGDGKHQIKVRVSGEKRGSSSDNKVEIDYFSYRNHSTFTDIKEEQDESLLWSGAMLGV